MSAKFTNDGRISLLSGWSSIDKPPPENGESKAQYRWRLLRYCVKTATKVVKDADMARVYINHGVEHQRRILCHKGNATFDVCFNHSQKELIILGKNLIQTRHYDGRMKQTLTIETKYRKLIHMHKIGLFVGWTPGSDELILMTRNFEPVSVSNALGPIFGAAYNEYADEVFTVGQGFFVSWVVRYGGRYILPRRVTENDVLTDNQFTMVAVEPTASKTQRAFAASDNLVAVFSVQDGTMIKYVKNLHVRPISALLFFNPLKYLITGCKDGCIKIWDERFNLQLVFVGHNRAITALALHPHGPLFLSASQDNTLRVWSLETCDEIDKVPTNGTVNTLISQQMNDIVCTISGTSAADMWKMQHVYQLHTSIGIRVLSLKSTNHPFKTVRTLVVCADSGLRLISPITGEVITTYLGDKFNPVVDACYSITDEAAFSLHGDGLIVKADMRTNPATKVAEWPLKYEQALGTCMTIYEHVARRGKRSDMASTMPDDGLPQKRKKGMPAADKVLLFVGRCDGSISNLDVDTGHVDYHIDGHLMAAIVGMTTNYAHNQLLTAGTDNTVRLWRVFAHARECLAPMYTFYCTYLPAAVASIKNNLMIAYLEHASATYMTSAYNLDTKARFDHGPNDDHTDEICCLAACPTLKIFASCSRDGTLRIWTEECTLLRLLRLKAVATSLAFCSERGDLLIGIGACVYKIEHKLYLPKAYRVQLLMKKLRVDAEEKALPYNDEIMAQLTSEETRRLKLSRSFFKFTHYVDVLTGEELKEMEEVKKVRDEAFGVIDAREDDITRIRNGDVETKQPKKSAKAQQNIKTEAFNKYLKLFYDRPPVDVPKDDDDILKTAKQILRLREEGEPREPEWKPCPIQPLFFNLTESVDKQIRAQLPISLDGQLPNSALLQPLRPLKPIRHDGQVGERWRPPGFTAEQLELISQIPPVKQPTLLSVPVPIKPAVTALPPSITSAPPPVDETGVGDDNAMKRLIQQYQKIRPTSDMVDNESGDAVRFLDYDDEESIRGKERSSTSASSLARMHEIMNKAEQRRLEREGSIDETAEGAQAGESTGDAIGHEAANRDKTVDQHLRTPLPPREMSASDAFEAKLRREQKEQKEQRDRLRPMEPLKIERKSSDSRMASSLSPAVGASTPQPQLLTPDDAARRKVKFSAGGSEPDTLVATSPAERPPTPLPSFITQFRGQDWFDKYFPNCNERTLPKPWDVHSFVLMLVRVLKISEWEEKVEVMQALRLLHLQETIPDLTIITNAVHGIFNLHVNPPRCNDPLGKLFIVDALKLLQCLGINNRDYVLQIMMQYLQGDREVKKLSLECLQASGLEDRNRYLPAELDLWDLWGTEDPDELKEQLLKSCQQFLDKWSVMLKNQLNESLSKLTSSPKTARNKSGKSASNRKTPQAPSSLDNPKQTRTQQFVNKLLATARGSGKPVVVEMMVDRGPYVDVLTFFCETQVDRLQMAGATQTMEQKNTIVALPHIPTRFHLVRLGETHRSVCKPHRETVYCTDFLPPIAMKSGGVPAPGQLYGFPPYVNLPLKPVHIDPFGRDLEEAASHDKDLLLMLRSAQKYFIQSRSYVDGTVQ